MDTQPPQITCPANITVNAARRANAASNVTFSVTATDNCAVTNVLSVPASGSAFPVGVTTVTNTATDSSGNTSTLHLHRDGAWTTNRRQITCPANITVNAAAGAMQRAT